MTTKTREPCELRVERLIAAAKYALAAIGETGGNSEITAPRWIQAHLGEARKELKAAINGFELEAVQ